MVMSDYEVDFDDFAAFSPETQVKGPNLWLVQIAQNQQINGQQEVESWFSYEDLVDDWLDLTVLQAGK